MQKRLSTNIFLTSICACCLLLALFFNFLLTKQYYVSFFFESDAAAEIQFARTLFDNGEYFFSRDWFYSTEIRFLHNHLVMVPLFAIFNTAIGAHLASTVLISLFMAASAIFWFRSMARPLWQCLLAAIVVIAPFSQEVFYINLSGCYYSFFTAVPLLLLGLYNHWCRSQSMAARRLSAAGMLLLSVAMGMCGIRYALVAVLPCLTVLCAQTLIQIYKKYNSGTKIYAAVTIKPGTGIWALVTVFYGVGYCVYEWVLRPLYPVTNLNNRFVLSTAESLFEKILQLPVHFSTLLAPLYEIKLFSLAGILMLVKLLVCAGIVTGAILVWRRRKQYNEATQFTINAVWAIFLFSWFATLFTNDIHRGGAYTSARYLMPGIVFLAMLPILLLRKTIARRFQSALLALFCAFFVCMNYLTLDHVCKNLPENGPAYGYQPLVLQEHAHRLMQDGYTFGYGTFHSAQIMNVLSNFDLTVVAINLQDDHLAYANWLDTKSTRGGVSAPAFLVVFREEFEAHEYINTLPVLYENGRYIIVEVANPEGLFA